MSTQTAQIEPANQRPRHRLRIAAVSIAAVAAGAVPLAAHETAAHATTRLVAATRLIHRLESQGYVAAACTRRGTLMVDQATGRHMIVKLA
jgi:CTP-dependent riboflavin kinase